MRSAPLDVADTTTFFAFADTVATRDLPDATGGATIPADAINRITLAALSDRFAWIVAKAGQIA